MLSIVALQTRTDAGGKRVSSERVTADREHKTYTQMVDR